MVDGIFPIIDLSHKPRLRLFLIGQLVIFIASVILSVAYPQFTQGIVHSLYG